MDELMHRGCCQNACNEEHNENKDKATTYFSSCSKLDTYDWLREIPEGIARTDLVEIRFKNTRKAFYRNTNDIRLFRGDIVAVEASPGHDIGVVSLTGPLVHLQLNKYGISPDSEDIRKIYRKARQVDLDKWKEAIEMEHETMLRSRVISSRLGLNMKIGDVEYQGDKTKAIFYYIADERVDFRQLIKDLAETFRIRIEMKQIGARQEAGRIGGIGSCGREL
jgi:cell fate regulator YaaT (PSP1 superfamily)